MNAVRTDITDSHCRNVSVWALCPCMNGSPWSAATSPTYLCGVLSTRYQAGSELLLVVHWELFEILRAENTKSVSLEMQPVAWCLYTDINVQCRYILYWNARCMWLLMYSAGTFYTEMRGVCDCWCTVPVHFILKCEVYVAADVQCRYILYWNARCMWLLMYSAGTFYNEMRGVCGCWWRVGKELFGVYCETRKERLRAPICPSLYYLI